MGNNQNENSFQIAVCFWANILEERQIYEKINLIQTEFRGLTPTIREAWFKNILLKLWKLGIFNKELENSNSLLSLIAETFGEGFKEENLNV